MLKTLFKHEMRATAKTFMWLYIAFAAIAVLNALLGPQAVGLFNSYGIATDIRGDVINSAVPNAMQGILTTLYILSIIVISIITLVVIILRFYRNLLGDEGYLMLTLPVSREKHILSKLLVAVVWSVCTGVLVFLSILLLIASTGQFKYFIEAINDAIASGMPLGRWIILFVVMMLVSCITSVLMLYAAMAIGPNLLKNRVGGSILAFVIIYIASSIISTVALAIGSLNSLNFFMPFNGVDYPESVIRGIDSLIGSCLLICVIIGVACWFLTQFMMKRKLNLG